jgi:hypothetical protein
MRIRVGSHALLQGTFQARDEQNKGFDECFNYVLPQIEYVIVLGKH